MRLAWPPGVRSTRDGAAMWVTPDFARADPGLREMLASLPPAVRADLRAQIKRKRDRALEGTLQFCPCGPSQRGCAHDVKQSVRRPFVLEMRWKNVIDEDGAHLAARLYFTEPEHLDELTFLTFRAKYPDTAGWRAAQNGHMDEAEAVRLAHFSS